MKNKFILSYVCLAICAGSYAIHSNEAAAQEVGTLYYYNISPEEYRDHYYEWKTFLEYNLQREPCQNYRQPPEGFVMRGCDVYRVESTAPIAQTTTTEQTKTVEKKEAVKLLPIVSSYTIYFDFDRSAIRESEKPTLQRVASEIQKYNPTQVTVAGHADRAGPASYNLKLSERRAQSVAKALNDRNIENQIINKEAFGESDLAVPTPDGVKKQENRRVTIDFRK